MKLYLLNKNKIKNFILVILFLSVSVLYSVGIKNGVLSVFINNSKELPIYCVEKEEKVVSLTFDAAWGANYTEDLLRILKQYDVKATFFLVEFWVENFPEMVKKIDEEGHEIGNHSATHPKMSKLTKFQIIDELTSTGGKINQITGKEVNLFRPPFGDYNNTLIKTCRELGYQVIQWDVDSLDYKDYGSTSIVNRVMSKVKNGSIVLFHNNATFTKDALPIIIDQLQKQGYRIVPVSELIYKENYYIDHTGMQKKLK